MDADTQASLDRLYEFVRGQDDAYVGFKEKNDEAADVGDWR